MGVRTSNILFLRNQIWQHTRNETFIIPAQFTPGSGLNSDIAVHVRSAVIGDLSLQLNGPFEEKLTGFAGSNPVVNARCDVPTDGTQRLMMVHWKYED